MHVENNSIIYYFIWSENKYVFGPKHSILLNTNITSYNSHNTY